jgi:acyl carrier protein
MDPSYKQDPIFTKAVSVLCEVLKVKPETVTPKSRIKEDLGADSLDTVSLLMSLEDEFKEPISDETAKTFVTFGDVVAYISSRQTATATSA